MQEKNNPPATHSATPPVSITTLTNFIGSGGSWLNKIRNVFDANSCCIFCLRFPAPNGCCHSCQDNMPIILRACRLCALPLEYALNGNPKNAQQASITNYSQDDMGYLCPTCYRNPPEIDSVWAPYAYYTPLSRSLHLLKFSRLIYYGFVLGSLWKQMYLQPQGENKPPALMPDLILPVPLHFRRQGDRGFNQAVELITPLIDMLGIPISKGNNALCIRSKATEPQINLAPKERSKNVRNAFVINRKSPDYASMRGKNILVVDDVVTTGTTINELAKCLKKAGAAKVAAWSLLRA